MNKREITREDENNARKANCELHLFVKVRHKIDRWKCHSCGFGCCGAYVKGYEEGLEHKFKEVFSYGKNKIKLPECPHYYRVLRKELIKTQENTQIEVLELECQLCGDHIYESRTIKTHDRVKYTFKEDKK